MRLSTLLAGLCLLFSVLVACATDVNVRDFGALGDGKTDDTAAFQQALDAAGKEPGTIVEVPRGNYRIATHLTIPAYTTLKGVWNAPQSWTEYKGTTFLAVEGAGQPDGTPFITMMGNTTLQGITIYYPDQKPTQNEPTPYPWTIVNYWKPDFKHFAKDNAYGAGVSIIDCLVVNPYQCVNFNFADRHYIRGLYGQPLYRGLMVDNNYDIGRIENVHFWPFLTYWEDKYKALNDWQLAHATAFTFARNDWAYLTDTFCYGYNIGYHFVKSDSGGANGKLDGIGADCVRTSLKVDYCIPAGLLITNGMFSGYGGEPYTDIIIGPEVNDGVVSFSNCSFWCPSRHIADIYSGTAIFTGCSFREWDADWKPIVKRGDYALNAFGGQLTVNGCNFSTPGKDIYVGDNVTSAVIMGNQGQDGISINNRIGDRCAMYANVLTKTPPRTTAGTDWYALREMHGGYLKNADRFDTILMTPAVQGQAAPTGPYARDLGRVPAIAARTGYPTAADWRMALALPDMTDLDGSAMPAPVRSSVLRDDQYLYLRIQLDGDPASAQQQDFWQRDHIELFLRPALNLPAVLQFAVGRNGERKAILHADNTESPATLPWDAQVSQHARGWQTTLRLPIANIKNLANGDTPAWGLALGRADYTPGK